MQLNLILGILVIATALALVWRQLGRVLAEDSGRGRTPFCDKLLRPPGESLRVRIAEVQERLMEQLLVIGLLMAAPAIVMMLVAAPSALLTAVLVYGGPWLVCWSLAWRRWPAVRALRNELRNCRLGFDGERYVAAQLEPLIAKGYRVFNDFPLDGRPGGDATTSNIDHIVIGSAGVFAIETKTRRKPHAAGANGQQPYQLFFDGSALTFPNGYSDRKPVEQAQRNADTLARWLSGSAPEQIHVTPVVAIPGWMIERTGRGTVAVLNPKELAKHLPPLGRQPLPPEQLRHLADRLDDKCRDVEPAT